MKKVLLLVLVVLIAVGVAGIYVANVFPGAIAATEPDLSAFTEDQIAQGENLARLGDCAACHTVKGAKGLGGGLPLPTPFGVIHSTNITPDPETGIGTWSLAAFTRAMRDGVDREGAHLYPAFPFDHFAGMTDNDIGALYAYLMTQDPVVAEDQPNGLGFPYNIRYLLAGWKFLFHKPAVWQPDPDLSDEENRGKYLVDTLGHCGACHSPRNGFGAVDQSNAFAGGEAEGWLVPPIGAKSISPVGWDIDAYADYLFDGWSEDHGIAAGPMTSVVDNMYEAEEDDVFAMAAYLAKITPEVAEDERKAQAEAVAALDLPASFDGSVSGDGVTDLVTQGGQVFAANCLKCHKERTAKTQPLSLGVTWAVNAPEPTNVFNAVVHGIQPSFGSSERVMQPIALSAGDLAAVAAYVRWHFTDRPAWDDLPAKAEAALAAPGH